TRKDEPESFSLGPFSRDGTKLLITSKKGWYVVTVADPQRTPVLTLDPDKEDKNPKVAALEWAPDGSSIYATYSAPDRWERGVVRLPLGRPAGPASSVLEPLVRDTALHAGPAECGDGAARARHAAVFGGAALAQRRHVRLQPVGRRPSRGSVLR